MYKWMPIGSATDLTNVEQVVDPEYAPKSVAAKRAYGPGHPLYARNQKAKKKAKKKKPLRKP